MTPIRRVWVTRASPGAERTGERLTAVGFDPVIVPLLAIAPLGVEIDLAGVDALAFTSVNGVEAFAAANTRRDLLVLAVGETTARAAREAGFPDARSADGELHALADLIRRKAQGLKILHPGAAEPAGDLAALVGPVARIRSLPVYRAIETGALAPPRWDAVLIQSPRAARALKSAAPPGAESRLAVALSAACAAPLADLGFAEVRIAAAPTEDALLSALGNPGPGV